MEWEDVSAIVGKTAPLLGVLLEGPAGAALGGMVASALGSEGTPNAVQQAIVTDPDAAVKLAKIEADQKVRLQELSMRQAGAIIDAAGNQTMQIETREEHWPTYSWRPMIGLSVALAVVLSVLTVFLAYGEAVMFGRSGTLAQLPGVLAAMAGIIAVVSPILGIASYFRGKMQLSQTTN